RASRWAVRRSRRCRRQRASGSRGEWRCEIQALDQGSEFDQASVRLRPAVAEELPHVPHFSNLVEVELGGHELIVIARCLSYELPARIAEVALPIELTDPPRVLVADSVDRADEERIRNGVRGLLELPEVLAEACGGSGRIEHDRGAVQPELARAFGEMTIVADVDADVRITSLEHRVAEIPGMEVELLPEAGRAMRDVVLAILAEVRAVGIDHGGGVVVDPGAIFLVQRDDDHHLVLLCSLLS